MGAASELTDHQIETILLAPRHETTRALAERLGTSFAQVSYVRRGQSKRGLRIGARLGVFPRRQTRTCFIDGGGVVEHHVDLVAERARHTPYNR